MTALIIVDAILVVFSLIVLVPSIVLFAELVAAGEPVPLTVPHRTDPTEPDHRTAVLMPAHDEAAGIALSIAAVLRELGPSDHLLVVADNCSDATAEIAHACGARVLVRDDPTRRGKGFALDAGVRSMESDPPDIVVIVDADCIVAPGSIATLAALCDSSSDPVQALYLMHAPPGSGPARRIAAFAWIVKNQARPSGAAALGWPCQLMGTGMAFPWALLRNAPLASGHLVEDMQLGLDLAAAGHAPWFCPQALVTSEFPIDGEGVASQRTRWEHGHLSMIASAAPKMLWRAIVTRDSRLLALVMDLLVPPLASLAMVTGSLIVLDALAVVLGASVHPLVLSTIALVLSTTGVALAWSRYGRSVVAMRELAALPLYVLGKIPVYASLFTKRQVEWVRTRRDKR